MTTLQSFYHRTDQKLTRFMADHGIALLRFSVGIVFFWFGFLKFFPALSPAEDLAVRTIRILTLGLVPDAVSLFVLALWETVIGIGLIWGRYLRPTLFLLWLQMFGTITPLFFFPAETFTQIPYAPTLEGQYIIKNLVLISAGLVIGATVRGGGLVADPAVAAGQKPRRG